MTVRVLIVDDEPLLRTGLRMILESDAEIRVVGEAGDGRRAVQLAAELRPDVVLMDIRMPVLDGLAATDEILGRPDAPRVVVLTTFDHDEHVFAALDAGASGFLLKDATREELVRAVHAAASGDAVLAPSVTRRLLDARARHRPSSAATEALDRLTARERETLELLAEGLTNAEIAERMVVGEATVKTHVANVLMKLGRRDRVQAVIFAYEAGIAGRSR